MTSLLNWQEFLKETGHPADTACLTSPNPQHALVKVTGSDAENFLHAQLSNTVTGLEQGEVRFAAWCNAKGRVWTLLHFWRDAGAIILRMPADQVEATVKRLRMFILRSDVQLEPLEWQALQFIGPDAGTQASQHDDPNSYNIPLPTAWSLQEVWTCEPISSDLPELPRSLTALSRILAGIPEVFADQREEWIPQMLNLDQLNAIDFKKGCYPGQEIVAKLNYKGGLKQRLITAQVTNTPIAPQVNDELTNAEGDKLATIIEVASTASAHWLLAVARLSALAAPLLYKNNPAQTQLVAVDDKPK